MAAYCELSRACHASSPKALDTWVVRLGPIFTAFLAGTLSLSFFVHEKPSPPTFGHAVAGVAIAVPTAFLIWVMTRPGESREGAFALLFLQLIATAVALTALASQRTNLPPMALLLPLAVFLVPLVATTVWIVRPRTSAAAKSSDPLRIKEIRALPLPSQLALVLFSLAIALVICAAVAATSLSCSGGPGVAVCLHNAVNIGYGAFFVIVVLALCSGFVLFRLMPADVRATFKEARARATGHPDDAPRIVAELGLRVPAVYRPRLAREIYVRAGLKKGMNVFQASRYATKAARQSQLATEHDQPIAS